MTLWGRTSFLFVCLAAATAAEPALEPVSVCQATSNWKEYEGKPLALIGRYSFREAGPQKGRWLDQEACDGKSGRGTIRLLLDPENAPKPPEQIAIDETALEKRMTEIREHTTLGKFRFGSPDYDRWAVVIGRMDQVEGESLPLNSSPLTSHSFRLTYRGDGAVLFLAGQ
jgi:hypothetical protein